MSASQLNGCCSASIVYYCNNSTSAQFYRDIMHGTQKLVIAITIERQENFIRLLKQFKFKQVKKTFSNPKHHHPDTMDMLWYGDQITATKVFKKLFEKAKKNKNNYSISDDGYIVCNHCARKTFDFDSAEKAGLICFKCNGKIGVVDAGK